MISSRDEYIEYVQADKNRNMQRIGKKDGLLLEHSYYILKYQRLLRQDEYFSNLKNPFSIIFHVIIRRRRNRLGMKLGFTIPNNVFGKGLLIWHYGNIVINGYTRVGENCILHGDNCIGNNGTVSNAPVIGNNVDIGVGAKILGNITIADNIKIGAGAVVVSSFLEEGITIVGVPARKLTKIKEYKSEII